MDHVARAEVQIGAPADRVWEVLTSPEPRPEIMFGARTVSDWQPGHRITWSGQWQGHLIRPCVVSSAFALWARLAARQSSNDRNVAMAEFLMISRSEGRVAACSRTSRKERHIWDTRPP